MNIIATMKLELPSIPPAAAAFGVASAAVAMVLQSRKRERERRAAALEKNDFASPVSVVRGFLAAQDRRDLDLMCSFVDDNIVYINEPHDESRHIRGIAAFRAAFEGSPCIWAEDAKLEVLRQAQSGDTVFFERRDQFLIDGKWLDIPICGYMVVKESKVTYWKDYWCYKKYKDKTIALFGEKFSMFKSKRGRNK